MKRYRVSGQVAVTVTTVVEVEDDEDLTEEEIIDRASAEFGGVQQLVGNGGCGDKLIGVDGEDDTIEADGWPDFNECELEEEE